MKLTLQFLPCMTAALPPELVGRVTLKARDARDETLPVLSGLQFPDGPLTPTLKRLVALFSALSPAR